MTGTAVFLVLRDMLLPPSVAEGRTIAGRGSLAVILVRQSLIPARQQANPPRRAGPQPSGEHTHQADRSHHGSHPAGIGKIRDRYRDFAYWGQNCRHSRQRGYSRAQKPFRRGCWNLSTPRPYGDVPLRLPPGHHTTLHKRCDRHGHGNNSGTPCTLRRI